MASEIRITDPYLVKAVEAERVLRGDKSASRTAGWLITERLTDLGRPTVTDAHPAPGYIGNTRTGQSAQLAKWCNPARNPRQT